jgi:hypothetical protein
LSLVECFQAVEDLGPSWYSVAVKGPELWEFPGNLTFQSGKLIRIAVEEFNSQEKPATTLAKAFYSAVASSENVGPVDVWTSTNRDANSPMYEVHLRFKDREVVISSSVVRDWEVASVKTYFPRALKSVDDFMKTRQKKLP